MVGSGAPRASRLGVPPPPPCSRDRAAVLFRRLGYGIGPACLLPAEGLDSVAVSGVQERAGRNRVVLTGVEIQAIFQIGARGGLHDRMAPHLRLFSSGFWVITIAPPHAT